MTATTAKIVRLPGPQPTPLDDGPATLALLQREIRRSGWRYSKIADRAGVCALTVSRLAYGDTKRPQMPTIIRILKALGWSVYASEDGAAAHPPVRVVR